MMRVGTWVACHELHHPVILARELATLDVLTGGRLDVGLGAGYVRVEFRNAGIPFVSGAQRFQRLQDSVAVMKALWTGEAVTLETRPLATGSRTSC
jgi:alkanesulfonate monooxygenase SsuD/methylene tetrahydromethanopterin reductase-like flavin-dependent oxidoreductase (luciferase family)